MKLGLRSILLLAAVVLFVIAIFVDRDQIKWIAAGLAVFAAAFFVSDVPVGRFGRGRL